MYFLTFTSLSDYEIFITELESNEHITKFQEYVNKTYRLLCFVKNERQFKLGCHILTSTNDYDFIIDLQRAVKDIKFAIITADDGDASDYDNVSFILVSPFNKSQCKEVDKDAYYINNAVKWNQCSVKIEVRNTI